MCPSLVEEVVLLRDLRLVADELADSCLIRAAAARGAEPEALRGLVREPVVAVGERGQLLAQLGQGRLRVHEIPDQDADDGQPDCGSFAISALIIRSRSASLCPKSSRY